MSNPYLTLLHRNLPRFLGQVNSDQTDPYYGCADRQFWAWKLIDFPNATPQAAVHGLALLRAHDMLPDSLSSQSCLETIKAMIAVIPKLSDRHGGLAEALPYEGSFCVTSLVLSNVLAALSLIEKDISEEDVRSILSVCTPLVEFMKKQDEHHGIISNHLATAALAMYRWHERTGDAEAKNRAEIWLARIRENANLDEGWMSEYGGADPGYQSWALTELVQLNAEGLDCQDLIQPGYQFLSYFAMPDGSFANAVGARLTRFFFPGGAEMADMPLAGFARDHIQDNHFVSLDSIDAPNFAPFFNDLALAATHMRTGDQKTLPHQTMAVGEVKIFDQAGLLVYRGKADYKALSMTRCDDYLGTDGRRIYTAVNGRIAATDQNKITLRGDIIAVKRRTPSALSFLILRLLSLSVFQFLTLGNKVKCLLAQLLIKSKGQPVGRLIRHIDLETGQVTDELKDIQLRPVENRKGFSPTHMASQGYWQKGDTQ